MRILDKNFLKVNSHLLTAKGERIPSMIYSYETKSKLYDIIVVDDNSGRFFCRTNSRKTEANAYHREIDKHFNLMLEGL